MTKEELQQKLDAIKADPQAYVNERLAQIDVHLSRVKHKTTPKHAGNKTMYQHLKDVKVEWQKERRNGGLVDAEIAQLEAEIQSYD